MLFHDPSIIKLFDIKLFFHAPFDTLKSRREARKGYTTAEGFWVDPPNTFRKLCGQRMSRVTHICIRGEGRQQ